MSDQKLKDYLSALLSFADPKSSESCAERLSDEFGSLGRILYTGSFALSDTILNDENVAAYIRLVAALTSRRITDKFKNGKKYLQNEIEEYIVGLFCGFDVENVFILLFDENDRLISTDLLGDGTVNSSSFLPRKLLDVAVRKGARRVIMAHNHPGGDTKPSGSDIYTTSLAKSVLRDAGIAFTNHYIVSGFDIEDCIGAIASEDDGEQSCSGWTSASVNKKHERKLK